MSIRGTVKVGQALAFYDALMKNKAVVAQIEGELGYGKVPGVKAHETGDRDVASCYLDVLYYLRDRAEVLIADMTPRFQEMARQSKFDFAEGEKGAEGENGVTKGKRKKKARKKRGG